MSPWAEEQEWGEGFHGEASPKKEETDWNEHQAWEKQWHGNCINSYWEETKQLVYARKMGLKFTPTYSSPYSIDLGQKQVLDIGGGAYSLLLKCFNFKHPLVVDPCPYPNWVYRRYDEAGIAWLTIAGENFSTKCAYDEVWIYNCLQHTIDPEQIIKNALGAGKILRLFEWIDTPMTKGHPQTLTEEKLNAWLGGIGKVEQLNETGCIGKAFYGVFKGDHYVK